MKPFHVLTAEFLHETNTFSKLPTTLASFAERGLLYGGKDYVHHANQTLLAIIQIETLQGLQRVDEIAQVEGLDMLYVGPSDLGLALGREARQNQTDPVVMQAVAASRGQACVRHRSQRVAATPLASFVIRL